MKLPPITRRQRDILHFFQQYTRRHQISPTLEEIAQSLGINRVTVFGHVAELERKGVLKKSAKGVSRALVMSPAAHSEGDLRASTLMPILGTIAAGAPIEAIENPDTLDLYELFPPGEDVFALRVRGDSMIEDSIADGDIVIVRKSPTARDGDIVVAILPESGEATLKRYYREGTRVRLQPSNSALKPLIVASVEIRGIAIGILRRF
jgi:repressor LexA